MTPTETATILHQFNERCRDCQFEDKHRVMEAIDAAVDMIERLEAAEKDVALKEQVIDALGSELNAVANERDALRAKVAEMERQEPVAIVESWANGSYSRNYKLRWLKDATEGANLYLAPGAQPAPAIPDGWTLVPIVSTDEMDNAGSNHCDGYLSTAQAVWDAMLAAAPEASRAP